MTNTEAIKTLRANYPDICYSMLREAVDTAIEALNAQDKTSDGMRLIDANKLKEDVLDLPNCQNEFSDTYDKARILDLVDEQPAIDAVEVVRCEKCRWFGEEDEDGECWCFLYDISTLRHGFCYRGKRKEE